MQHQEDERKNLATWDGEWQPHPANAYIYETEDGWSLEAEDATDITKPNQPPLSPYVPVESTLNYLKCDVWTPRHEEAVRALGGDVSEHNRLYEYMPGLLKSMEDVLTHKDYMLEELRKHQINGVVDTQLSMRFRIPADHPLGQQMAANLVTAYFGICSMAFIKREMEKVLFVLRLQHNQDKEIRKLHMFKFRQWAFAQIYDQLLNIQKIRQHPDAQFQHAFYTSLVNSFSILLNELIKV